MSGVCIRAGHHCAEPLLKRLGESSTCRASIALYNDAADIDRLVAGLETVWKVFNG
jgi:cysteine desulfurase/selenocysteine lyase